MNVLFLEIHLSKWLHLKIQNIKVKRMNMSLVILHKHQPPQQHTIPILTPPVCKVGLQKHIFVYSKPHFPPPKLSKNRFIGFSILVIHFLSTRFQVPANGTNTQTDKQTNRQTHKQTGIVT